MLDLVEIDGLPGFKPTFQECDDIVRGVLDSMVLSVSGLPKVGSNATGSAIRGGPDGQALTPGSGPGTQSPSAIPTTTLFEDSVVHARKVRQAHITMAP